MPQETEEEGEPPTPKQEATGSAVDAFWQWREAESTRLFGPPAMRKRKNKRHTARLVARYSEPVIRGLLVALSRVDELICTQCLSEMDLAAAPLWEIIQPFELGGYTFRIESVQDTDYVVDIAAGSGTEGDGGRFLIARHGETFTVKEILGQVVY